MIRDIIRKEIIEEFLDFRFQFCILIFTVVIISSFYIMTDDYKIRLLNYQTHIRSQSVPEIIVPPEPLSILVSGVDKNISRFFDLSYGYLIQVGSRKEKVNLLLSLFSTPDLLFVVKIFMSLIAIVISFDAVCGEKEIGNLKMVLSNKVSRTSFILAKFFAKGLLILLPFNFLVFLFVVSLNLLGILPIGSEELIRLLLFILFSNLYILIFVELGLFVSTLFHSSASSMTLALLIWVVFVFLIPSSSASIAKALTDVPPVDKLEEEKIRTFIKIKFERNKEHPGYLGYDGLLQIQGEIKRLEENFRVKLAYYIHLARGLNGMFPAGSLTEGTTKIMRTSIDDERRFKNFILRFRERNAFKYLISGEAESLFFKRASFSEAIEYGIFNDLLILIIYFFIFLVGFIASFNKYDLR